MSVFGWAFGVPVLSSFGTLTSMRITTAVCFLVAVASLLYLRQGKDARGKAIVSAVAGAVISAAGLLTLAGYLVELGTGRAWRLAGVPLLGVFLNPDIRMSIITAILFSLFGCALALVGSARPRADQIGHAFLLPVVFMSYLILVGYILNVPAFYQWLDLGTALSSGIAFFALCFAAFAVHPETWLMKAFVGPQAGAVMARRLLPALMALPLLIGWMRLLGERTGAFGSEVGVVLVAAVYAACLLWLVWLSASRVNRTDLERRLALDSLRESEERFRLLFQQAAVGIKRLDPHGLVIEVNDKLCQILGYSREELLYLTLAQITHPEDLAAEEAELSRLFSREVASYSLEKRCIRKDGSVIWVRVTSSLPSASGLSAPETPVPWWISVVEDITKRKLAEAELGRSNRDLEQFAYVSSHDLQEPLRMVTGFMQLFEQKYKPILDETGAQYVRFAVEGARRMQQLIDDLLSYSRVGSKAKEIAPVDAAKALSEALANLRARIEESVACVTVGQLPLVRADERQLAQLFQNLVGNALKFNGGGQPPRVSVEARRDGGEWIFSVKDEGIGIDPEHFERIFMIFQRLHTREEYPGTGIGLAICKKIVERHGGRIWVESSERHGSTFFFTLPE
jgi:PAS domain S-box-containing protein